MTKIPSIQSTNDFIFRKEWPKGYPLRDPDNPHLLVIDGLFNPSNSSDEPIGSLGSFQSLDVTVFRDGNQVNDVGLNTFHHRHDKTACWFSLEFTDAQNSVSDHNYLVTIILRYLV